MALIGLFGTLVMGALSLLEKCTTTPLDPHANDVMMVDDGTIALNGVITGKLADRFEDTMSRKIRRVTVNSAGGLPYDAMRIGRLIRQYQVELVIDDVCLGACAQFVFPAATRARLTNGSVVAFRYTSAAGLAMLEGKPDHPSLGTFQASTAEAVAYYREIGVSEALLYAPSVLMQPACYNLSGDGTMGMMDMRIGADFDFFVPSREALSLWGVGHVSGFWPISPSGLPALLVYDQRIGFLPNTTVTQAWANTAAWKARLAAVPYAVNCSRAAIAF